MRCIQRIGNLYPQIQELGDLERTPLDHVLQGRAFQILHGDKRLAIFLADVIDRADIRMIQGRCRLRLPLKTAQSLRVLGYVIGKKLERHKAMQPRVLGLVHHAHAAAAHLLQNAVMRNDLVSHSKMVILRPVVSVPAIRSISPLIQSYSATTDHHELSHHIKDAVPRSQ